MKVNLFRSTSQNPYFNLALEDYLVQTYSVENTFNLFLWRNTSAIILGRFQNPLQECTLPLDPDVFLVRRETGGGTVYHDLGNYIFSFFGLHLSRERNFYLLLDALQRIFQKQGFDASMLALGGRNDVILHEKTGEIRKISGSAFKHTSFFNLHHGTVLYDVDLDQLEKVLKPSFEKLKSHGIDSVRSRVRNLKDLGLELSFFEFGNELSSSVLKEYSGEKLQDRVIQELGEELLHIPSLKAKYNQLRSEQWIWNETPPFSYMLKKRFSFGEFEISFEVEEGKIKQLHVISDYLHPEVIEMLQLSFQGKIHHHQSISVSFKEAQSNLFAQSGAEWFSQVAFDFEILEKWMREQWSAFKVYS